MERFDLSRGDWVLVLIMLAGAAVLVTVLSL